MTAITVEGGGALRHLPAYAQVVRGRIKLAGVYRQTSFFLLGIVVVQVFILREVWSGLYGAHASVNGLSKHALLVYLTIANIQGWVMQDPTVSRYMYERVRQGLIAFDLIRPSGFVPQMFAHLAGSTLGWTLFVLPALPFLAIAGSLDAPASLPAAGLYVVSLLCGWAVTTMIALIIGMVAFWTPEIEGLTMLYRLVSQFFAGALVPLSFFPEAIRIPAEILPFQSTIYTPVAIYVGRLHGMHALQAIGLQVAWAAALAVASWAMWRRALHHVVVQGG